MTQYRRESPLVRDNDETVPLRPIRRAATVNTEGSETAAAAIAIPRLRTPTGANPFDPSER